MKRSRLAIIASFLLIGAGCTTAPAPEQTNQQPSQPVTRETVLVSTANASQYCDGATMDSEGYRSTITQETAFTPAAAGASEADRLRAVLNAATTGMCNTVVTAGDITVENGVARIPPIDAWAGVSITMCSCKPEVEVNLLRQPGITSVEWAQ